jgi:membrane-bound inhibitor of C-type lysozyme
MCHQQILALICVALPLFFVSGCKSCKPAEEPASQYEENMKLTTFAYDCDQDEKWNWVASYNEKDDTMTLFAPGNTVTLPHVRSGSGARYSDGKITYWSKGDEATIEIDGKRISCREVRRRSWIEQAKLEGFDFYAVGNEPGWNMRIGSDKIVFITDYGNQKFTFQKPKIEEDAANRMTTYKASMKDHKVDVVLRGTECADSMSGEKFETSVLVVFDGKPLPGCGLALH